VQLGVLRDQNLLLKKQLEEIDHRIILKKRYSIQYANRGAKENPKAFASK
jgi:hypothetical protein